MHRAVSRQLSSAVTYVARTVRPKAAVGVPRNTLPPPACLCALRFRVFISTLACVACGCATCAHHVGRSLWRRRRRRRATRRRPSRRRRRSEADFHVSKIYSHVITT